MALIEGKTSAELREKYMQQHVLPMVDRAFERDGELQSVVVAVAQYWNDEADDAVHIELVPCRDADPKWPECLSDGTYYERDEKLAYLNDRGEALVGWDAESGLPCLDENSTAITAFGAYCLEGCHQEMPLAEAYTPYAIVRRGGPGAARVEVVGEVIQPQWEDRFDVGFAAELEVPPAKVQQPESALSRWKRRIFGEG